MQQHTVSQVLDLSTFVPTPGAIIDVSVDATGINTLIICAEPQHYIREGDFAFPAVQTETPQDYRFLRHDLQGRLVLDTLVKNCQFNYHFARYLPTQEILLVCARCRYGGPDLIDQNAVIVGRDGVYRRGFTMGDGIRGIALAPNRSIWASYFDEGVYGNYGWKKPIGKPGLLRWNMQGKQTWAYEPPKGMSEISDCYAMNLDVAGNCWICYYGDFPLVKIGTDGKLQTWKSPIRYSNTLHVHDDLILMDGGSYSEHFELLTTGMNHIISMRKLQFQTAAGEALTRGHHISSAGNLVGFWREEKVYLTRMEDLGGLYVA
jgi:hypothetical protein